MARILLLGASGMLGSALHRALAGQHVVTAPDRAAFDILRDPWSALPVAGQDWVLNAAGLIPRRAASAEESWIANAVFPQALAADCARAGARLIHVSTDCVFAGRDGPHDETRRPDAPDTYGRSKAFGEPVSAMVLRTSIIGPEYGEGRNLICWVLRQDRIDGYVNHVWNGVTTGALARTAAKLIEQDVFAPGVHHVHGEAVTKHALVSMICDAWQHDAVIRPVHAAQSRDQRLVSIGTALSSILVVPSLQSQLRALSVVSTGQGKWKEVASASPGAAAELADV